MYVDSSEVTKNILLPGLQVFRLLDEVDEDGRLHHTYQIVYTGDAEAGLASGSLSATLVSPTEVAVVMPGVSGAFLYHYSDVEASLTRKLKTSSSASRAHTTAVNHYTEDPDSHRFKALVKFDKTYEELTNKVWSDPTDQFGVIHPKSILIATEYQHLETDFSSTELFVTWNIARVEPSKRYQELKGKKNQANLVADGLSVDIGSLAGNLDGMDV